MQEGDRAIVLTDDGGHFYKGKEVEIVMIMDRDNALKNGDKKYVWVKALDGQTTSWYAPEDLKVVSHG